MHLKLADDSHPNCKHGPTILFWKKGKELDGYYACSAFRDLKDCPVKIPFARSGEFTTDFQYLEYHNGRPSDRNQLVSN